MTLFNSILCYVMHCLYARYLHTLASVIHSICQFASQPLIGYCVGQTSSCRLSWFLFIITIQSYTGFQLFFPNGCLVDFILYCAGFPCGALVWHPSHRDFFTFCNGFGWCFLFSWPGRMWSPLVTRVVMSMRSLGIWRPIFLSYATISAHQESTSHSSASNLPRKETVLSNWLIQMSFIAPVSQAKCSLNPCTMRWRGISFS